MIRVAMSGKQVDVVVPAAGQGKRMNCEGNKLLQSLRGVPIIYRTLCRLSHMQAVRRLVLVIRDDERGEYDEIFQTFGELEKSCILIEGGGERYDSVRNGLKYVASDPVSELVMTHDGARPFLVESQLKRLMESVQQETIAIPVQAVSETVRIVDDEGVTEIVDRSRLFLTQTPQLFHSCDIERCFLSGEQKKMALTDEAGYFEALGLPVRLVDGDKRNIKITTPADLAWAGLLLENDRELRLDGIDPS